jgi:hypothetical protein
MKESAPKKACRAGEATGIGRYVKLGRSLCDTTLC